MKFASSFLVEKNRNNSAGGGGFSYTWSVLDTGYHAIAAVPGVAYSSTSYSEGHDNRPSGYPRSQLECEERVGKTRRTAGREAQTIGL